MVNPNDTYFHPDSMIRKVNQEALVLLGGGRSILLQLAHPLVMAGVADHSYFQKDILNRLYKTMEFMHNIVFESHENINLALERFNVVHHKVQGELKYSAGAYEAGASYYGNDPELKLWVFATFFDSALETYGKFVKPLSRKQCEYFYNDAQQLAVLMGIPKESLPQTLDGLQQYMKDMLKSDAITVTPTSRKLARDVLYPKVGMVPYLSAILLRFVTSGLMPEKLRKEFGMKWNWRRQLILNILSWFTRVLRPITPSFIWQTPLQGGKLTRLILWGALPVMK